MIVTIRATVLGGRLISIVSTPSARVTSISICQTDAVIDARGPIVAGIG